MNDVEGAGTSCSRNWQPRTARRVPKPSGRTSHAPVHAPNRWYHRCPENWEKIVQTLAYNALGWAEDEATVSDAQDELIQRGCWTLDNLTAAFKARSRVGALES